MSDEAAKRRELRKQRILGNSENRLKRILNKEEQTESVNGVTGSVALESVSPSPLASDRAFEQVSFPLAPTFLGDVRDDLSAECMDFPYIADTLLRHDFNQRDEQRPPDLEAIANETNPIKLLCELAAHLDKSQQGGETALRQREPPSGPAFLRDYTNATRIRCIFILGIISRCLLPTVPTDFAKLFGPLYLLEVLLFSLCFLCRASLESASSMNTVYSLLSLLGMHPWLVRFGKLLSSCFELVLRDMWIYSFSFFVTHALCQQLEICRA